MSSKTRMRQRLRIMTRSTTALASTTAPRIEYQGQCGWLGFVLATGSWILGADQARWLYIAPILGAQVFGADPSRAALRLSEKRARMAGVRLGLFEFDGKTLPFRDSSFDAIIMADVAEHIDDSSMSRLLDECSRLLLPGGRLVLHTAPALEAIRICRVLRRLTFGASRSSGGD